MSNKKDAEPSKGTPQQTGENVPQHKNLAQGKPPAMTGKGVQNAK